MDFLFFSFDPSGSWGSFSNWYLTIFPCFFLFFSSFWKSSSTLNIVMKLMFKSLNNELKPLFKSSFKTLTFVFVNIFFLILGFNLFGLFPYVFTPSSHIPIAVSLGLPIWLGVQVYCMVFFSSNWLSHLVPLGSPTALAPFLVLVEFISNIIRPLTLSIRLVANMFAGHMILSLSGEGVNMNILIILALIPLVLLELGVALIQSFVFSLLSSLYASEFI